MTKQTLDDYRAMVSTIFDTNIAAILKDPKFDDKEKAGTLVLLATNVLSCAAFLVGTVDPRLKNAPPEAQIDDMLTLMRQILVTNKPVSKGLGKAGLTVVGGKDDT